MSSTVQKVVDLCNSSGESQLRLHYSNSTVTSPGKEIPKEDAKNGPTYSIASKLLKPGKKYIIIALDPDAPAPTVSMLLSPILHEIQAGLEPQGGPDADGWVHLKSTVEPAASYLSPNPPPVSSLHRYVFIVWEQPEDLPSDEVKTRLGLPEEVGRWPRIRWDQDGCEKKLGLGEILGGNYFWTG